mmetsp:Transcript_67777/g.151340  ORF Transcript_67777/g.151340 Transcript_67777/m.151340 type:complete len:327 (+) Transcript_67777:227-1207(+)
MSMQSLLDWFKNSVLPKNSRIATPDLPRVSPAPSPVMHTTWPVSLLSPSVTPGRMDMPPVRSVFDASIALKMASSMPNSPATYAQPLSACSSSLSLLLSSAAFSSATISSRSKRVGAPMHESEFILVRTRLPCLSRRYLNAAQIRAHSRFERLTIRRSSANASRLNTFFFRYSAFERSRWRWMSERAGPKFLHRASWARRSSPPFFESFFSTERKSCGSCPRSYCLSAKSASSFTRSEKVAWLLISLFLRDGPSATRCSSFSMASLSASLSSAAAFSRRSASFRYLFATPAALTASARAASFCCNSTSSSAIRSVIGQGSSPRSMR